MTLLQRYLDAANRGDVATMLQLTHAAVEFGSPRSVVRGRAALRAAMVTPRPFDLTLEPERWFVADNRVLCVAVGRFRLRRTGEAVGEAPRFVRGEVDGERLRRIYSGYRDAASALADAGLTDADEWEEGAGSAAGASDSASKR